MILVEQQVNIGIKIHAFINVFGNIVLPDFIDMSGNVQHPTAELKDNSFTFF